MRRPPVKGGSRKWHRTTVVAFGGLAAVAILQLMTRLTGKCGLPEFTLARCDSTGEISLIEDGHRRQFSAETYASYGFPAVHINETGACPLLYSCRAGLEMTPPEVAATCLLPADTIVRCKATGMIAMIVGGVRRPFSGESYGAYGSPLPQLNETGSCSRMFSCPQGETIPTPQGPCKIPNNNLVRCASTQDIFLIEGGKRRKFSMESYVLGFNSPKVHINDTGLCQRTYSCPVGSPMPEPPPIDSACQVPESSLILCKTTGELSIVYEGKRWWFSAEALADYGYPAYQLNETGSCPLMSTCQPGGAVPRPEGECTIPNGQLVRCSSTQDIFLIEKGLRRKLSGGAYAARKRPQPSLEEKGLCPRIYTCKAGENILS